jgi:hypothetical protein
LERRLRIRNSVLFANFAEVGLEISVEKTKYMLLSRQQNVGQNRDIEIPNRSFENVSVQIFEDDSNKSKFDSRRNYEEIEFW